MPILLSVLAAILALSTATLAAQGRATTSAPGAYRTQFENDYVELIRVHYGPNEKVPAHEHPTVITTYIYLNASGPVEFRHVGEGGRVATRQPTTAGSFRVSRGGDESHAVVNTTAAPSDFLRVEFKTDTAGASSPSYRDAPKTYPAGENAIDVEFTNPQMRITRLVVAPGSALDVSAAAREPALIIALDDGTLFGMRPGAASAISVGQERWLDAGQQSRIENPGAAKAELLRIDFLTAPRK